MLSREECLKIMDLEESAQEWDIEKKYTMLVKKYRTSDTAEARNRLDEISLAYNILTGRYIEPEPINPRMEKVVAGKTVKEWQNIWHYGRWPLLAIIVIAVIVIALIHSIATNEKDDFAVIAMGQFYDGGEAFDLTSDYIKEKSEGSVNNPVIHIIPLDFSSESLYATEEGNVESLNDNTGTGTTPAQNPVNVDAQSQYAYNMKLVTLLYSDSIDVFMSTGDAFRRFAGQGIFMDLSSFYESLSDLPNTVYEKIKPVYARLLDEDEIESDQIMPDPELDYNGDSEDMIMMGLDVSELALFEGLDLWMGDAQIISVGTKSRDEAMALRLLDTWIRDYEQMEENASALAAQNEMLPAGAWDD